MNEDAIEFGKRMQKEAALRHNVREEVTSQMQGFFSRIESEKADITADINKLESHLNATRVALQTLGAPTEHDHTPGMMFFAGLILGTMLGCLGTLFVLFNGGRFG